MSLIAHYLLHNGFDGLLQTSNSNLIKLNTDNSGSFSGELDSGLRSERTFSIGDEFSWFVAVKRNSETLAHILDMRKSDSYGYQPLYLHANGNLQFHANYNGAYTSNEFNTAAYMGTDAWHYIVILKKGFKISCYVDGHFINKQDCPHAVAMEDLYLHIGQRHTKNNNLDGMISDVRLYDHVLSDEEIKKLSSDLVCHYTFDTFDTSSGSTRQAFMDCSKSSLHATGNETLKDTDGLLGTRGARIAQADKNYIEVNPAVRLVPPFTYSIWAKISGEWTRFYDEKMRIWSCTDNGGFNIEPAPSNAASCTFAIYDKYADANGDGKADGYENNLTVSATDYKKLLIDNPDAWHIFTITLNNNLVYTAYIDGEQVGQVKLAANGFQYNDTASFFLGAEPTGNTPSNFFDGWLDDFRAYRKALTKEEIQDLIHLRGSIYKDGIVEVPYYNNTDNTDIQLSPEGVLSSNLDLVEQAYKIIDGKTFLKVFEHDVRQDPTNSSGNAYFKADHSEDYWSCGPNRFSMLGLFYNDDNDPYDKNDYYEFLLTYPDDTTTDKPYNHWRQNWGLFEDSETQIREFGDYQKIYINENYTKEWGHPAGTEFKKPGLGLNKTYFNMSLLDCEPLHENWWGSICQYEPYKFGGVTGFPAPDGKIHQWVQLWVRVDNTYFKEETFIINNTMFTKGLMEE